MASILIHYTCKYTISFAQNYWFTTCGICYNVKTGRIIKKVMKGGSIGYTINGKFRSLKYLKDKLVPIKKGKAPF